MDHINVLTCTADELQQVKAGKKNSDIDVNTIINYRAVGFFLSFIHNHKAFKRPFLNAVVPKVGGADILQGRAARQIILFLMYTF